MEDDITYTVCYLCGKVIKYWKNKGLWYTLVVENGCQNIVLFLYYVFGTNIWDQFQYYLQFYAF